MLAKYEAISQWQGVRGRDAQASGFLFTMASDPICRWLVEDVIPKDRSLPDCLHSTACAFPVDFAVADPSFRILMPAVAPTLHIIDEVTSMNLDHNECY